MANEGRLSLNEVSLRYPSQSGERANYFSIKENGGTRRVRFLYNTIDDVFCDVIHEFRVNNKTTQVKCLNPMQENANACPLCAKGHFQKVKLYIPLLDVDTNEILIWNRSKSYAQQLMGLMARNNPLSGKVFEITRNGAPGDMKTSYGIYPMDAPNDGRRVEDILASLNKQLPPQESYMRVMDFNAMTQYANSIDSVQGNVPAQRPTQNYSQNGGYGANGGYNSQPTYATPNPQQNFGAQGQQTGGFAPQYPSTTPMTPPNMNTPTTNRGFGSEPVRRNPQSVTNAPVVNASVTTSVAPQPTTPSTTPIQSNPTAQPSTQPVYNAPQVPTFEAIDFPEDDLPF